MSDHNLPVEEHPPLVVLNPDGSYTRPGSFQNSPPTSDQDSDTPVLTKDLTINHVNKTGVRIHIPKETITTTETRVKKLPLIVYFHGGGFVLLTAASTLTHAFCNTLSGHLSAVVVSVDYRLAPEHRLPAAYEDGVEALHWIKSTNDPWLTKFADFSNCYIMGTSAGANLAYHAGLRVCQQVINLEPLKINGMILHNPFFGGVERMDSEIRLGNSGAIFTLSMSDESWDWALPIGASRDHEYCNPMMGSGLEAMGRIKDAGWRVVLTVRLGDLMIDRQMEFAKALESKGVECKCFYGDGDHGIEYLDNIKAQELCDEISSYLSSINR
ncbi:hypothetical protein M8C21_019800 [Ambrosia artemisiifolia]|uniref:Alpha/beta hydrolase fold-3 domain-containing protein n=1 Tax=Ambrosia artemisiifolia TaxID=4212 RepID=A0AAD5C4G1_AMBAR|nr:hypothetical protein M8C21_019800 [Ambrosia artemisiifolia]